MSFHLQYDVHTHTHTEARPAFRGAGLMTHLVWLYRCAQQRIQWWSLNATGVHHGDPEPEKVDTKLQKNM